MADWYLYMIRCRDGNLYTGITTDVPRRFTEHQQQGKAAAKYLKGRGPLTLVYQQAIGEKSLALRREREVKKLPKAKKEMMIRCHEEHAQS